MYSVFIMLEHVLKQITKKKKKVQFAFLPMCSIFNQYIFYVHTTIYKHDYCCTH